MKCDDPVYKLNIEIKARCDDLSPVRSYLKQQNADFRGTDFQKDTYFNVTHGRLKIREGNIESCIVAYDREANAGPKKCRYRIIHFTPGDPVVFQLNELLSVSLGILCRVTKKREIYFIGNVKFHLDDVDGLGTFFEIEAINTGSIDEHTLRDQCERYLDTFGVTAEQLITVSYSDMLL